MNISHSINSELTGWYYWKLWIKGKNNYIILLKKDSILSIDTRKEFNYISNKANFIIE